VKVPEIFQVETPQGPGGLASVLNAMAEAGLVLEHVSTVRRDQDRTLWEITVEIDESAHAELLARLNALPSARFVGWSYRVFDRHRGGKIAMRSRVAVSTQQILRDIYTPGVARVCLAIRATPEKAFGYTNNVLCFPGLFDAVLRTRARTITDAMLVAAAHALADVAATGQLLPDPLNVSVHQRVSQAVQAAGVPPVALASERRDVAPLSEIPSPRSHAT
jgi:hypothetical protein